MIMNICRHPKDSISQVSKGAAIAVANWNDPLWSFRVMYQLYGMAGLVRSVAKSWGWITNLYRGPIYKMTTLPRRPLLMVPPPVTPNHPALRLEAQTV